MEPTLEQMAGLLAESGDYRVTSRLGAAGRIPPTRRHSKARRAVVDVEATGTNPDRDKIIEFGIRLFEYDCQSGRLF
jgi:DNA polymerase-3 subunit epsilon